MWFDPERASIAWRRQALHAAAAALLVLAGCGDHGPTGVPIDPTLAAPAADQAARIQQVAASEALLDDVSRPFASAVGDVQELGDLDVDPGFDDLATAGATIARSFRALHPAADLGAAGSSLGAVVSAKAWSGPRPAIAAACSTENLLDGTLTVCAEPTDTLNVVRLTLTRTWRAGPLLQVRQRFLVHDGGTPLLPGDDRTMRLDSDVSGRDGGTITMSIQPVGGDFILDDALVAVDQRIRPAGGLLEEQRAQFTMDVGVVASDGDEVYFEMALEQRWRNGARTNLTLVDDPADGITSGDDVQVTAQFTAAPGNPRLQSVATALQVLVHELQDPDDDQVVSLVRDAVFDGTTASGGEPFAHTEFVPSAPVSQGEEPCGGRFERQSEHPASWDTRSVHLTIEIDCAGAGSSVLDVGFADGSEAHRTIVWDAARNATLTATWRDGTQVQGAWNAAAQSFTVDTTFPAGHDPVSVHQEGSAGPGTRDYLVVALHTDASTDSLSVHGQATSDSTRSLTGWARDDRGRIDFAIDVDIRHRTLHGSASGPDDETLDFSVVPLAEEEGVQLDFTFADPSQRLTVVGSIALDADGAGCGTLVITLDGRTDTVPICIEADGDGIIADAVSF